jgi:hypothetical protein
VAGLNYTIFDYFASASHDANMTVRNNILDGFRPTGQTFGFIAGGTPVQDHNFVTFVSYNGSETNPLYINPAAGNFALQASSAAIDAGVVSTGITDGYVGTAPDQGAYEYGQTAWVAGSTLPP